MHTIHRSPAEAPAAPAQETQAQTLAPLPGANVQHLVTDREVTITVPAGHLVLVADLSVRQGRKWESPAKVKDGKAIPAKSGTVRLCAETRMMRDNGWETENVPLPDGRTVSLFVGLPPEPKTASATGAYVKL